MIYRQQWKERELNGYQRGDAPIIGRGEKCCQTKWVNFSTLVHSVGRHVSSEFANRNIFGEWNFSYWLASNLEGKETRKRNSREPVSVTPAVFPGWRLSLRFGVSFSVIGSLDFQKQNSRVTGKRRTHTHTYTHWTWWCSIQNVTPTTSPIAFAWKRDGDASFKALGQPNPGSW